MKTEKIVFGGGCFWCVEAVFKMINGVKYVVPGYAGGEDNNPTYEKVSGGSTGHAEVILVEYNSDIINFKDLLLVFFASHDPTTLNRQGNDVGTQYRSIILYSTEEQKAEIEKYIKEDLEDLKVVTEVKKLDKFYNAEDYHQNYYENNSGQMYCQVVINPKLNKIKNKFSELIKNNN